MDKLKKVWAWLDGLPARYPGLPLPMRIACWVAVLVFVVFMAGCASPGNIKITEEDAKACAAAPEPCSVWTMDQLKRLIYKAMEEGWNLREQQGKAV